MQWIQTVNLKTQFDCHDDKVYFVYNGSSGNLIYNFSVESVLFPFHQME